MTSTRRDPLVGGTVDGRYEVLARVARGGMSTVYRALDLRLDREVALKVLHPHLAEDPAAVARFEREAKTAARLSHPHVVAVLDQGHTVDDDGDVTAYLVMEYVPGATLRTVIADEAPVAPRRALDLLDPVVDGLAAAHRAGLVHRDVKPENVLVRPDGRITVADFGLSRATTHHTSAGQALVGTPAYLAPELIAGEPSDARADVYAVGVMLFELLAGRQPFTADTPLQVAYRHLNERVPAPSMDVPGLAEPLDDLVLWCTEPDPADRPEDAVALLAALRELRASLADADLDLAPPPRARPAAPTVALHEGRRTGDPDAPPAVPRHASGPAERPGPGPDPAEGATRALPVVPDPAPTRPFGQVAADARPVAPPSATARPRSARQERREARRPDVVLGRGAGRTVAIGAAVTLLLTGVALLLGWSVGTGGLPFRALGSAVVPDVAGLSRDAAQERLAALGVPATVRLAHDERFSDGTVTASSPAPGASVTRGTAVELVVSSGPAPVPAPDLVGASVSDAETRARAGRVGVDVQSRRTDRHVPAGSVLEQSPAAGTPVTPGEDVRVVVSEGPAQHALPDVGGRRLSEARAVLEDLGYVVTVHELPLSGLLTSEPLVRRQGTRPGTALTEGSAVELWVL